MKSLRTYWFTWVALLALLAVTCGSSFIAMGPMNLVVNMACAVAKAVLVAVFFMHIGRGGPMVRIAALGGLAWLAILFALSANDFLWRGP